MSQKLFNKNVKLSIQDLPARPSRPSDEELEQIFGGQRLEQSQNSGGADFFTEFGRVANQLAKNFREGIQGIGSWVASW